MTVVDASSRINFESSGDGVDQLGATRDWLDLEAGRLRVAVLDTAAARAVLASARRIAVIGASPDPWRPSHGVMLTLVEAGYEVLPVNPTVETVAGIHSFPTLADAAAAASGPIDIVDVFRRWPACPDVAREAVAVGARCLWLQLGLVNREAGRIAAEAGLAVVMDRCTAIELAHVTPVRG